MSEKRTILKNRVLVGEIWTQLTILGFLPKKVIQIYNEHVNCYKLLEKIMKNVINLSKKMSCLPKKTFPANKNVLLDKLFFFMIVKSIFNCLHLTVSMTRRSCPLTGILVSKAQC